jgi:hypothetical protein
MTFMLTGAGRQSEKRCVTRCLLSGSGRFRLGWLPQHDDEVGDAWIDPPEAKCFDERPKYAETKVYAAVLHPLVNLHGALIDDQGFDGQMTLMSKILDGAG